ncbi:MAG: AAA family ATPase [Chloroflexi bacterium]|nr:AAA family ATPase [Chloroflexota bacterium]
MPTATVDFVTPDYDEGACTIQLRSDVMKECGVEIGDVVRLSTKRGLTALARIAGADVPGSGGSVRLDRQIQRTIRAAPREEVQVERADVPPATRVLLMPVAAVWGYQPFFLTHIRRVLSTARAPLSEGMLIYIPLPNVSAGIALEAHSVQEGGEGYVTADTEVFIELDHAHEHGPDARHFHKPGEHTRRIGGAVYEDVGGLDDQVRAVREFVELPLVFPQIYRRLGIMPPRGVIFYGAPGTGKTLLARTVANEVNANFYYINGPEVVGTYSGQTEENLRRIFRQAATTPPSIIFIDEIDTIAPMRGGIGTMSDARAVTQLLTLMDGLEQLEGQIVIGTTNRIEAVDPALRRPGRFDKEVYFATPPPKAREQILRIQSRNMPLSAEAHAALPRIAELAYGYVGADLMELAREAGMHALRRVASDFLDPANSGSASYEHEPQVHDLQVGTDDFDYALSKVKPTALRESMLSFPDVTWAEVGGLETVKRRLRDLVEKPLHHPDLFNRLGLPTSLGVLLYGPPGTGKTMLAKAVAREFGVNFVAVHGPELFSQWVGGTEENVRRIFNIARRTAPCVIFFDQLEAIAPARGALDAGASGGAQQRAINQLLGELDGMEPLSQVVVIGATNTFESVDPAMLRPGRFGVHLYVGLPDVKDREAILRVHLQGAILDEGTTVDSLVETLLPRTERMAGADLAYICQSAKIRALDELDYAGDPKLTMHHFEGVLTEFMTTRDGNAAVK